MATIWSGQTIQVIQKEEEFITPIQKHYVHILSTHYASESAFFMKSLYKIVKAILVLYTVLQTKIILSLNFFFKVWENFKWYHFKQCFTYYNCFTVHGFHQLISQPIHLLPQSSSCTDLMFTDQTNLAVDCDFHLG